MAKSQCILLCVHRSPRRLPRLHFTPSNTATCLRCRRLQSRRPVQHAQRPYSTASLPTAKARPLVAPPPDPTQAAFRFGQEAQAEAFSETSIPRMHRINRIHKQGLALKYTRCCSRLWGDELAIQRFKRTAEERIRSEQDLLAVWRPLYVRRLELVVGYRDRLCSLPVLR